MINAHPHTASLFSANVIFCFIVTLLISICIQQSGSAGLLYDMVNLYTLLIRLQSHFR